MHIRLKLSIDRQLCAGFTPGRRSAEDTTPTPPPSEPLTTPAPLTPLARRAATLQAKLSGLSKLKSLADVEREWAWAANSAVQLCEAVLPTSQAAPWLFGLAQQVLQTGPLSFGKPAQFKRLAKALDSPRASTAFGHPHARAVRKLLDALLALLPPEQPVHGEGSGVVDTMASDAGGLRPPGGPFSDKQCAVLRGWGTDFRRSFPAFGGGAAAGPGRRLDGAPVDVGDNSEGASASAGSVAIDDGETSRAVESSVSLTAAAMSDRERRLAALARRGLS